MDLCSVGGCLSVDFANSITNIKSASYKDRYPTLVEMSVGLGSIDPALASALLTGAGLHPRVAEQIAARAVDLGNSLEQIFRAVSGKTDPPPSDLVVLNRELASAMGHLRLRSLETGLGWEWEEDDFHLDRPLWPVARSAADLLVSPDCSMIKSCANEKCEWVFVDATKNHRRRWCDMKVCGNREKVRRHRARTRASH